MIEDRPKKIAEEISGHIPIGLMAKALAIGDKDDRCGAVGLLLRDSVLKSNLATHKGTEFWWNPELGFWVELEEKEIETVAELLISGVGLRPGDILKREPRMIQMVKRSVLHTKLSPKREIISFKNCVLDVSTGKTSKLSPESNCIYGLSYSYDPNATCPKWISFLEQVLPDIDSRAILQEYLGCIFINRKTTKLEKILYLHGGGSNGKSVIYMTISGILGENNVTGYDVSRLAGTSSESLYALAECDGKLLNYCSDAGKKEFSSDKFKTIVSGEPTDARRAYGRSFMASNLPILMCNSNELPITVDSTYGFSRRLIIIPMDITISEENQDKQLHMKLSKEYPGILNWILQGRDRLINNDYKFTTSKKVAARVKDYEIESNSILGFLRENRYSARPAYIGHIPNTMPVKKIYEAYTSWCITMGLKAFSFNKLGSKLKEKGFACGRRASIEYGVYELPIMDEYRKLFARAIGNFSLEEYGVMLYGRDGDNIVGGVVENIVERDAKEPIADGVWNQVEVDWTEGATDEEAEEDECP